jgi:protein TonB
MNHRVQARAAQDHVLRESLAGSSMSALTLVVAAMLTAHLFAGPGTRIVPAPPYVPPDRTPGDYVPEPPPPPGRHGGVVPPDLPFELDEAAADTARVRELPPADLGAGDLAEFGTVGPIGIPGGAGAAPSPIEEIPAPGTWVWREEDPVAVERVVPEYPGIARDAGLEGRVRVRLFVGVDGRVRRAEVVGPDSVFDRAALDAVRQWVFTPAKANGHPVGVWIDQPIVFRLD